MSLPAYRQERKDLYQQLERLGFDASRFAHIDTESLVGFVDLMDALYTKYPDIDILSAVKPALERMA